MESVIDAEDSIGLEVGMTDLSDVPLEELFEYEDAYAVVRAILGPRAAVGVAAFNSSI